MAAREEPLNRHGLLSPGAGSLEVGHGAHAGPGPVAMAYFRAGRGVGGYPGLAHRPGRGMLIKRIGWKLPSVEVVASGNVM